MKPSRREFVGSLALTAGGLCLPGAGAPSIEDPWEERECVVLDLGAECALRESLHGYFTVVGESSVCSAGEFVERRHHPRFVIVPGAGVMDELTASALLECLDAGGTVVVESGAGFWASREFGEHQRMLKRFFDLTVTAPLDLWSENRSVPYVEYSWPCEVMIRDFGRAVPVRAKKESEEVIGLAGGLPVALRKRVDNGSLIFLGSPLGPALRAGDSEARAWLATVSSVI